MENYWQRTIPFTTEGGGFFTQKIARCLKVAITNLTFLNSIFHFFQGNITTNVLSKEYVTLNVTIQEHMIMSKDSPSAKKEPSLTFFV